MKIEDIDSLRNNEENVKKVDSSKSLVEKINNF